MTKHKKAKERREDVEILMLSGLDPAQIWNTVKGAPGWTWRKVRYDCDKIQTEWLKQDRQWWTRAHLSRIETAKRYRDQISRLNTLLERDASDMELTNMIILERTVMTLNKSLHEVECEIDPDMYLKSVGGVIPNEHDQRKENKISA